MSFRQQNKLWVLASLDTTASEFVELLGALFPTTIAALRRNSACRMLQGRSIKTLHTDTRFLAAV